MSNIWGYIAPVIVISAIFLLNALLPGRWVDGYITRPDSKEKMRYRLNGLSVLTLAVMVWFIAGYSETLPFNWLYLHRWEGAAGACVLGLIFSLTVVFRYKPVRKNLLADLFLGRAENISFLKGRIDAKMWLYLVGAVLLELNVLSFAAHHQLTFGSGSNPGIFLATLMLTWFVAEYLYFEEVHLYTYDIFAERVGFKLGWGCLVFYPYFYSVPLWSSVALPNPQTPQLILALAVVVFFSGWSLARGANMQKYYFKRFPERKFLWITPVTITDGNKTLLVNGFWGISRHINYLGEILMASGIVIATGYYNTFWPWLYPLYYVLLLFTRQWDDDRRCAAKYGSLWAEYKTRVPWRIIPYIW